MSKSKKSYQGAILAGLMIVLKSTKIIAAIKLVKFTKPLITVLSLLISALVYGLWLGPWFGVGFLVMLFIHEMGHIIALRIKGIETPGPVFIPFLGAAIFAPQFKDRHTEAFVGYGGPLLGTIAALGAFGLWFTTDRTSEILLLISYVGLFLNLFNLIPISPLDGGRITQIIGGWFKYVGLAMLLVFTIVIHQPQILMIWVLILSDIRFKAPVLKPSIATVLGVGMFTCMVLGFSNQPWCGDVLDCFIVAIFIGLYWHSYMDKITNGGNHSEEEKEEELPYPPLGTKLSWLGCYLGLSLILIIAISQQVKYLPEGVHKHSEKFVEPADEQ